MKTILGVAWFSGRKTLALVHVRNEVGKESARLSWVPENGIEPDAIYAASMGSKFPLEEAISIIHKIGDKCNISYGD